jgi:hypothetical protein
MQLYANYYMLVQSTADRRADGLEKNKLIWHDPERQCSSQLAWPPSDNAWLRIKLGDALSIYPVRVPVIIENLAIGRINRNDIATIEEHTLIGHRNLWPIRKFLSIPSRIPFKRRYAQLSSGGATLCVVGANV